MKKYIFYMGLQLIVLCTACQSKAQNSPYVGFYDGSRMELVFHGYILPQNAFALSMIYGSEDRLIVGTWKDDGKGGIILEENREQGEPFIVYTSDGNSNKRILNFKYFDQNTGAALAIGLPFDKTKLKYIHKPDENCFSAEYNMEANKNSSGTLFLSRPIAEDITHEVYTFELPDKAEDVFIMYNALADKPVFRAGASFQNDVLMLVNEETNEKQRTGKKQPLPADIEKDVEALQSSETIADTRQIRTGNGKILKVKRLRPGKIFLVDTYIKQDMSYFGNDTPGESQPAQSPAFIPAPPSSSSHK